MLSSRVAVAIACVWVISEGILLAYDRGAAYAGAGLCAYLGLLAVAVDRLSSRTATAEAFDAREPHHTFAARCGIVVGTVLFVTFVYGFVANWVVRLPVLTPLWAWWTALRPPLGATAIPNALLYVVIPGAALVALGLRLRSFGLVGPMPGYGRALAAVLILPALTLITLFFMGRINVSRIGYIAVRNLLSAGGSEEILFRGYLMSHVRPIAGVTGALLVQALAFGVFHWASSVNEPNALVLLAYLLALNAVPGCLLGLIALRSNGLVLPISIHTSMGMMRDAF
jgi:membrane protease YdiL (CAAX protease family)